MWNGTLYVCANHRPWEGSTSYKYVDEIPCDCYSRKCAHLVRIHPSICHNRAQAAFLNRVFRSHSQTIQQSRLLGSRFSPSRPLSHPRLCMEIVSQMLPFLVLFSHTSYSTSFKVLTLSLQRQTHVQTTSLPPHPRDTKIQHPRLPSANGAIPESN